MSPIYGAVNWRYFESLTLLLCSGLGDRRVVFKGIYGDSLVSRARNSASAMFLEPGGVKTEGSKGEPVSGMPRCEWMMFIDSDLRFTPDDVHKLLNSGKKVIGGLYSKKKLGGKWVINTLTSEDVMPETGLMKIRYIGTGFLLIHRSIYEQIIEAYPGIAYEEDGNMKDYGWHNHRWDFWPVGVKTYTTAEGKKKKRYLSEDWYFCERLQEMGIDVWAHVDVRLTHYGEIGFPITPFVDGCDMKSISTIMRQAIDKGELETAEALQDTLESALRDKSKLGGTQVESEAPSETTATPTPAEAKAP